jgi:hypothetical protein
MEHQSRESKSASSRIASCMRNTGATKPQIVCLLALSYGKSLRVVFEMGQSLVANGN